MTQAFAVLVLVGLAGCTAPSGPGPLQPTGVAGVDLPVHAVNETDGFRLTLDETASSLVPGERLEISVSATNLGNAPAERLGWPCRGMEWSKISLEDASGTVLALWPPEPLWFRQPWCLETFGPNPPPARPQSDWQVVLPSPYPPLQPGETVTTNVTWDGTLTSSEVRLPEPPGAYVVSAWFAAFRDNRTTVLNVRLPLHILPPAWSATPCRCALFPPAHAENETDDYQLTADESAASLVPPHNVLFSLAAENLGYEANVTVAEGCPTPWAVWLEAPNGTALDLQPGPPPACDMAADSVHYPAFSHTETLTKDVRWNGTAYRGGRAYVVPPGEYTLKAAFTAWRGNRVAQVEAQLPVHVLAASQAEAPQAT